MSDSSSSEEDTDEKLRLSEAVVDFNHKNVTQSTSRNVKEIKADKEIKLPSLRKSEENTDKENSTFTPGIKKFIAKKLSDELDRMIDLTEINGINKNKELTTAGIKLFSLSKCKITTDEDVSDRKYKPKKRIYSSSSDSSEENERLAEASVSHEFIMSQSRLNGVHTNDTEHRSNEEIKVLQKELNIEQYKSDDSQSKHLPTSDSVKKKKKRHKDKNIEMSV